MYRLLIILALVSLAELRLPCSNHEHGNLKAWRHRPHHDYIRPHPYYRRDQNKALDPLDVLARDIIEIDRKLQQLCTSNGNEKSREVFGVRHYNLTVPLRDYNEQDIAVTVKYRLLRVNAQKPGKNYVEVRILPELVDVGSAHWELANGELSVIFPYIAPLNMEAEKTCEIIVDERIITLPKSNASEEQDVDIRLAHDQGDVQATVSVLPSDAHQLEEDTNHIEQVTNDLFDKTSEVPTEETRKV